MPIIYVQYLTIFVCFIGFIRTFGWLTVVVNFSVFSLCNFRYAIPPEHGKRLERLAQGKPFLKSMHTIVYQRCFSVLILRKSSHSKWCSYHFKSGTV